MKKTYSLRKEKHFKKDKKRKEITFEKKRKQLFLLASSASLGHMATFEKSLLYHAVGAWKISSNFFRFFVVQPQENFHLNFIIL